MGFRTSFQTSVKPRHSYITIVILAYPALSIMQAGNTSYVRRVKVKQDDIIFV